MAFNLSKPCPHCSKDIYVSITIERKIGKTVYSIFFDKHETGPENCGEHVQDDWPHA